MENEKVIQIQLTTTAGDRDGNNEDRYRKSMIVALTNQGRMFKTESVGSLFGEWERIGFLDELLNKGDR